MNGIDHRWLMLLLVPAQAVHAEDWRTCTELYVYAVSAQVSAAKPSGQPWDEGSTADPKLSVKPAARSDLPWTTLGAKIQDAPTLVAWNSAQPVHAKGAWIPLRTGEALAVSLVDSDLMADDTIVGATVELPKALTETGAWFAQLQASGSSVTVGVSAYDGKRTCNGVTGKPRWANIPEGILAGIGLAQFDNLYAAMRCDLARSLSVCSPDRHVATYADVNGDGVIDMSSVSTVPHSQVNGTDRHIYGAWLGNADGPTRKILAELCSSIEDGVLKDGSLCIQGENQGVVFNHARGTSRAATEADFARLSEAQLEEFKRLRGTEDSRGPVDGSEASPGSSER